MLTFKFVEHYRPSATISGPVQPWPSFLISSNQISGLSTCMTWLGPNKHVSSVVNRLDMLTLFVEHYRPSATISGPVQPWPQFPYFQQLDIGFKHVCDMVGTQQTRAKCCQSIRHAYLVCRTLSAQCNHQRPSATMAKFPYFQQLDIGFKHVYDMVGTQQTRASVVNRLDMLTWSVEHYRPSATISGPVQPWPSFLISSNQISGLSTCMTWLGPNKHVSSVVNRLDMLTWSVEHYRPSATISGPVQPWPSFLISSNQISGLSTCMTWLGPNKHVSSVVNRLDMLTWSVEHYRPSATISGPVQPWPSFLISSNQISGLSTCMTWLGPNKHVSSVVNRLDMLTWSVEHYRPSATISGPVQPWPSFLISSNQISGLSTCMTWQGPNKHVSSVVNRLDMLTLFVEHYRPSATISGPVQPWPSFLISSNQISG